MARSAPFDLLESQNPTNTDMFKTHTSVFVTFDPSDSRKSRDFIRGLEHKFPDRTFLGRHLSPGNREADLAILKTTLTLILETKATATSPDVAHDIKVSLAKNPRNEILRIVLDAEQPIPEDCPVAKILGGLGTEQVTADLSAVTEAFCRLDLVARHEPRIRDAVGQKAAAAIPCNRN